MTLDNAEDVEFAKFKNHQESGIKVQNCNTDASAHNPFRFHFQPSSSSVAAHIDNWNANSSSIEPSMDVLYCSSIRQERKSAVDDNGITKMLAERAEKAANAPAFVFVLES